MSSSDTMPEEKNIRSAEQLIEALHKTIASIDGSFEKFHGQHVKKYATDLRSDLMELTKIAKVLRAVTLAKSKELSPRKQKADV